MSVKATRTCAARTTAPVLPSCGSGCSTWQVRAALDIESLGYQSAAALLETGLLIDEGDLFNLTEEALLRAPFFTTTNGRLTANGHKLLLNLEEAKAAARQVPGGAEHPARGPSTAPDLAQAFGDIERIAEAKAAELAAVERRSAPPWPPPLQTGSPSTGTANIVRKWRRPAALRDQPQDMREQTLAGLSVVVTGSGRIHPRDGSRGHHFAGWQGGQFCSKTSFVVVGEVARVEVRPGVVELKVPILSGAEAFDVLLESGPNAAAGVATIGES